MANNEGSNQDLAYHQSCYGLLPADCQVFCYLYQLVQSGISELQQRTHGSVFDTITRETFEGLKVVSPESEIMSAFTAIVDAFFDQMLALKRESAKLADMRDYLLPKLLSGQIRVAESGNMASKAV